MMEKTKKCPMCGAICFEDMDVCFGCLHRFEEDEVVEVLVESDGNEEASAGVWEEMGTGPEGTEELDWEEEPADSAPRGSHRAPDAFRLLAQDGSEFEIVINVRPVTARVAVRGNHAREAI